MELREVPQDRICFLLWPSPVHGPERKNSVVPLADLSTLMWEDTSLRCSQAELKDKEMTVEKRI